MDMRMMLQGLAPGVEHTQETDFRSEMFGVAGDLQQSRGAGAEQEIVDDLLVLQGQPRKLMRQGENDMNVADRQQFFAAFGEPFVASVGLALRAVAIRQELNEMASWPHREQRSRWPPRVAVRQTSMA
jgi:hypothetical protein